MSWNFLWNFVIGFSFNYNQLRQCFPTFVGLRHPLHCLRTFWRNPKLQYTCKKVVKFNILRNPKTYQGTHVCRGTPIENHCSMMTIAWKLIIFFQGSQSYKPFSPVNIEILISGRSQMTSQY